MHPILSILRAAHCHSTHHYFAIDAIPLVQTEAGKRLTSQLLYHHARYLRGAKDPDIRFRDFQNHVIHVTDGYWGGAPRVAHVWYDRMQRYLRHDRFGDAAHAAGVLSHYFTDALQPLHTQQCDREKVLHRPIEWSITKAYHDIYRRWKENDLRIVFQLSGDPSWLGEAMLHGARFANRKYWSLIESYDLVSGAENAASGLNEELRESIAELFGLSITGLARVLERAATDAEATRQSPIPTAGQVLPCLLASIRVPQRLWLRHVVNQQERLAVEALVDEFQRTGAVTRHLPAEVDIVHRVTKVYQDEKRWKQKRLERLSSTATQVGIASDQEDPVILPFPQRPEQPPSPPIAIARLSRRDPLIDAPSIGPKTAARLQAIAVHTVGQFLDASADEMARRLATYGITSDMLALWQNQLALMCQIPDLTCRDAQWLAGVGFNSPGMVARSEPAAIHQRIIEYAATTAGRRHLRGGTPPTFDDVCQWIQNAATSGINDCRRSA